MPDFSIHKKLVFMCNSLVTFSLWHKRLGHPSSKVLHTVLKTLSYEVSCNNLPSVYKTFQMGNNHKLLFYLIIRTTKVPLQVVHTDVWGPTPITSFNCFKRCVHFVDEYTWYSWIFFLKEKSGVKDVFLLFKKQVELQIGCQIKALQFDSGCKLQALVLLLNEFGISRNLSCPYTSFQNWIAKRKHHHIVEMGLILLA